jgi:hypothetical protein
VTGSPLHEEQGRRALLGLLACAWLLGLSLLGVVDALAYLAPTLALLAALVLRRYPGEQLLARALRRPRRERAGATSRPRIGGFRPLPRGGALLAAWLAGRAPPPAPR